MRFGTRLKTARTAAGMSLRTLADKVGCSHVFIKDLETGARFPRSRSFVDLLATACDIPPDQLAADLAYDRKARLEEKLQAVERQIREIEEPVAA